MASTTSIVLSTSTSVTILPPPVVQWCHCISLQTLDGVAADTTRAKSTGALSDIFRTPWPTTDTRNVVFLYADTEPFTFHYTHIAWWYSPAKWLRWAPGHQHRETRLAVGKLRFQICIVSRLHFSKNRLRVCPSAEIQGRGPLHKTILQLYGEILRRVIYIYIYMGDDEITGYEL